MNQITLPEATETRQGDEQFSPALFPVSQTLTLQDRSSELILKGFSKEKGRLINQL